MKEFHTTMIGTTALIVLKLRKEDIASRKRVMFDKNKLPLPLMEWSGEGVSGIPGFDARCEGCYEPFKLTSKPYIAIFCSWDGYIEGSVGEVLKTKFTTYESVLNLISGGDCSGIERNGVLHYANNKNYTWYGIKPTQETLRALAREMKVDYTYLFENDVWKVGNISRNEFEEY